MIIPSATNIFISLTLLSTTVWADLICKKYGPRFYPWFGIDNLGVICYNGTQGSINVRQTCLQAGYPTILNTANQDGTTLKFESCNSTSLGYSGYRYHAAATDAGCPEYYIDYIRVLDIWSGDCMTSKLVPNSTNLYELIFEKCNPNPTTAAQLFMVNQKVVKNCTDNNPNYWQFFPAGFYSLDGNSDHGDQNPTTSWSLTPDGRIIQYFTANGTGTNLYASVII